MTGYSRFALGTFAASENDAFPGLVVGEQVIDLAPVRTDTTTPALVEDWDRSLDALARGRGDDSTEHAFARDLRPLRRSLLVRSCVLAPTTTSTSGRSSFHAPRRG